MRKKNVQTATVRMSLELYLALQIKLRTTLKTDFGLRASVSNVGMIGRVLEDAASTIICRLMKPMM